ncbi:hypothetical protein HF263_23035 [Rhizobium leguminosarum]|uniref:hypothetical protein n=1 Tax=Rhizobium leguminosarum TaxID=384 RepID=UPI001C927668|nr:hypothetical protein [Rhizobium leguminosarum]MBY2994502.1 hypothetical protein [Rhizobium leguminosarum]MBY3058930.1 hypothetical protein [Rhizobium leguminosarum]
MLVFVGEAAGHFQRYSARKFDGFFKVFCQHTTKEQGDLVWEEEDAVVEGNVIVIGRIQIIPITDEMRLLKLKKERARRSLGWPLLGLSLVLSLVFWALNSYAGEWWEQSRPVLHAAGPWVCAAAVIGMVSAFAMTAILSSRPDVSAELEVAREKARANGLY